LSAASDEHMLICQRKQVGHVDPLNFYNGKR